MVKLFVNSIFNAVNSLYNMIFKIDQWDRLFYEMKLCNRSEEYPLLIYQSEDKEKYYFTIPIGLNIDDFRKHKLDISTFLKVPKTNLKIEYKNNLALISVTDSKINNNYNDYLFNDKKGVPIGIDLDNGNIVYWKYYSPNECHLLIAGATGSGKSVCLNVVINNLIKRKDVELYIQDTKYIDLYKYKDKAVYYGEGINGIEEILNRLINEMNKRYLEIRKNNKKFKSIFLIIEELATFDPKENKIIYKLLGELLSKGRAANIYVILTTQTPYAEVLPGLLKSNINTKIGLKVNTKEASKVVCGDYDALTELRGKGHGKIFTATDTKEIQCFYIPNDC